MPYISRFKYPGVVSLVATLALALPAFAAVQRPEHAITRDDPHGNSVNIFAHPGGVAPHAINGRQFSRQKLNGLSAPEVFTFNIQKSTTISAITASNDFHVAATGTIELKEGSKVLAQAKVSSNTASFKLSTLASGTHQLTAYYVGDLLRASAESEALNQIIK